MIKQSDAKCKRCTEGHLKSWSDLNEEERIVVRRLPATTDYSANERETTHRWCTRCWYEETRGASHDA